MKKWFSRRHHAGTFVSTDPFGGEVSERNNLKKSLFDGDSDYADSDDDCSSSSDDPDKNSIEKAAGLALSKPLLLGFLYLACRQLRSCVISADLVRWCADGVLPFNNLWESNCIPSEYKIRFSKVPKSFERR